MINRNPPPKSRQSIPLYIVLGAAGATVTVIHGYYTFTDEAPLTKRKRLIATTPEYEREMGDEQYVQLLMRYENDILPEDHRASITVRRVGGRVARAADTFARRNLPEHVWKNASPFTYTVVRSDQANAFVLPGNHVFVLTGLFKYARDEDELAAVLGHEMAHNLARHAGEKLTGNFLMAMIARFVWALDPTGLLYVLFAPAAVLMHTLPHSREAETEADHIGVVLAAEACFDPDAAPRVFSNMARGDPTGNGKAPQAPPEFLSTHPSNKTRISNFDQWLPDARSIYNSDNGDRCRRLRYEMKVARAEANRLAFAREGRDLDHVFGTRY